MAGGRSAKVRMAVVCPLDAILLVPAGAFAFAVFALPSIAKRVPPTLACQRCGGRPLAGTGDSTSRHRILTKLGE